MTDRMNPTQAFYVEHISMESDTLERIELFGPYMSYVAAERMRVVCENKEDTVSSIVVKKEL